MRQLEIDRATTARAKLKGATNELMMGVLTACPDPAAWPVRRWATELNKSVEVPMEAEVQVIALSDDLAIVALPGEFFVELGLAIKTASPFRFTSIAELANGSIGYIPNREAYPQGNYEVVSARGAAGSGEQLADAAITLLRDLKNCSMNKVANCRAGEGCFFTTNRSTVPPRLVNGSDTNDHHTVAYLGRWWPRLAS